VQDAGKAIHDNLKSISDNGTLLGQLIKVGGQYIVDRLEASTTRIAKSAGCPPATLP